MSGMNVNNEELNRQTNVNWYNYSKTASVRNHWKKHEMKAVFCIHYYQIYGE